MFVKKFLGNRVGQIFLLFVTMIPAREQMIFKVQV